MDRRLITRSASLKIFQEYFALTEEQKVMPLLCPGCSFEISLIGEKNDLPLLRCFMCGCEVVPGGDLIRKVKAAVEGS